MKCPICSKWNLANLPHCVYCGESLENDGSHFNEPTWRNELADQGEAKAYLHVNRDGDIEAARDPREVLADEMARLKKRKMQGEIQQRKLRTSTAQRGMAPSGRTVRTTSNRGTFFSAFDNPDSTLRPVDPALIEEGEIEEGAQIIYTEKYRQYSGSRPEGHNENPSAYGFTQRIQSISEHLEEQPVYDGFHDSSAYMPYQTRPDEYEHSLRMRSTGSRAPRRVGMRRILRTLLIFTSVAVAAWLGWTVLLPIFLPSPADAVAEVNITPIILNDMAAHQVTIPGADGQRITIRELRTSAIVTDGAATFEIPDHIWYDDFEDYLQETMSVTLTPYLLTDTGKQRPLRSIDYEIDIPLSPIELSMPDNPYKVVSTAMYNIVFFVREGSSVFINGESYSDLVNTEGGRVNYNATVQPIGENYFEIVVRSQYCRENSMTVTLYRERQEIPLDLMSDIASRSIDNVLTIRAYTLAGAVVKVLSPYTDLDITNIPVDGSFTFKALFDRIGDNSIIITAEYPDKKATTVEHVVNYVPSIDVYSRKAWDIVTEYTDLMDNLDLRKQRSQIYVCIGRITSIETTKPQRAFMNCGTEESPVVIYVENASRTTWAEGEIYRLYGDVYGMYDSKPWLVVRYTYKQDEY